MTAVMQVLLGLAVLAALEAVFYSVRYFQQRQALELRRRLKALGEQNIAGSVLLRVGKLSKVRVLHEILRPLPAARSLETLLEQADLDITVAQLITYSVLCALGGAALGMVARVGLLLMILFALVGLAVPLLIVLSTRSRRSEKVSEQLPEALEMMTRSLRAGHALESAFQLVATEAPSPINVEFGRAFEEQRLGRTLEQAVVGITRRVPNNPDLNIFAVSVAVQKETGGNLSEILENIAETIRARYRFYGKLRALTAEGRVSGIILGSLPVLMLLLLVVINYSYIRVLFEVREGNMVLAAAALVWIVGLVWLFRLAKVEY